MMHYMNLFIFGKRLAPGNIPPGHMNPSVTTLGADMVVSEFHIEADIIELFVLVAQHLL